MPGFQAAETRQQSAWGLGSVRGTPFCEMRAMRRRKSTAETRSIVCQAARKLLLSSDNDHILSTYNPARVSTASAANIQSARMSHADAHILQYSANRIHELLRVRRLERLPALLIRVALFAERGGILHGPLSRLAAARSPSRFHSRSSGRGLPHTATQATQPCIT